MTADKLDMWKEAELELELAKNQFDWASTDANIDLAIERYNAALKKVESLQNRKIEG